MSKKQEKVKQFFDELADNYAARYTANKPYHQYFFQERIRLATKDIDFNGKSVLDIGAGTGALFDFLNAQFSDFQYYASDISAKMLENSNIPSSNYFVGNASEIKFPSPSFDYIFLLGVTTYLTPQEFEDHLYFITTNLKKDGKAIISFTNSQALDFQFRRLINFILRKLSFKKNVLGANFQINAFHPKELTSTFHKNFTFNHLLFFNHTFTPFNHLFPKLSIRLDKWVYKRNFSPTLLSRISADFLIKIQRLSTSKKS